MLSLAILNLSDILESVSLYLLNSDLSLFEQDPFIVFSNIINSPYVRVVMVIVSKLDQSKKLQSTEI